MGRRSLLVGMLIVSAVALVLWRTSSRTAPPVQLDSSRVAAPAAKPQQAAATSSSSFSRQAAPPASPAGADPAATPSDMTPAELSPEQMDAMGAAWSQVDMEEVRKAMPDNLYWKLSSPTKDPQVIEEREEERKRWNVEYGKVLSGTGTEEEIRAYYDLRAKISGDYIEFSTYLIDHYEGILSERDIGLLKFAVRLHRARLEEIPRKIEEAFERKRKQDAARAAWLADQQIFGERDPEGVADQASPE